MRYEWPFRTARIKVGSDLSIIPRRVLGFDILSHVIDGVGKLCPWNAHRRAFGNFDAGASNMTINSANKGLGRSADFVVNWTVGINAVQRSSIAQFYQLFQKVRLLGVYGTFVKRRMPPVTYFR